MEPRDLARNRETGVEAPKAHLSSLASWRCGPRTRTPKVASQLTVSSLSGRAASNSGQLWQENGGCRRSQIVDPARETSVGRASIDGRSSEAGQKSLDTEDQFRRIACFGN